MKRLKKLLFGMVTTVLLLASALTVYADPSRTDGPYISGEAAEKGWYEILPVNEEFEDLKENDPALYDLIRRFNEGEIDKDTLLENYPDVQKELEGKTAITDIFDLVAVNGGNIVDGKHLVKTITIPTLNCSMSDVVFLVYNESAKTWEIAEPSNVECKTGIVTVSLNSVGPVVVFTNANTTGGNQSGTGSSAAADSQAQGTSPKTEENNVWALWLGAAAVLMVCGSAVVSDCKGESRQASVR